MLIDRIRQIQADYGLSNEIMLQLIADYAENPSAGMVFNDILSKISDFEESLILLEEDNEGEDYFMDDYDSPLGYIEDDPF